MPRPDPKPLPPRHKFRPAVRSFDLPAVVSSADPKRAVDIWTLGGTDGLVVGDVVLVTEGAEVPLVVDGQHARKVGGRMAATKADGKPVKLRTLRHTLATVVDTMMRPQGRLAPTRSLVLDVAWSTAPEYPHAALLIGRRWNLFQVSVNAPHLHKRVERLRGSGPRERTDEAGRRMLLDRLLAVAGDDPVEALRLCVDPVHRAEDGSMETLGRTRAGLVVAGSMPTMTWMIRQLSGVMPIPAARDYDAHQDALMDEMDAWEDEKEAAFA